jgi:hypothetical protein
MCLAAYTDMSGYHPIKLEYEHLDTLKSYNTTRITMVTFYKFASISGPLLVYL